MSPTSYRTAPPRVNLSLVGLGRFELPTSRLSGVRSNQLSYRPIALLRLFLPQKRATLHFSAVRFKRWTRSEGRVASVANKLPAIYFAVEL